jgi:hypothetical protein
MTEKIAFDPKHTGALYDLHLDSITCKKNHKTKGNREGVRVSYSQTLAIILPFASSSANDQV